MQKEETGTVLKAVGGYILPILPRNTHTEPYAHGMVECNMDVLVLGNIASESTVERDRTSLDHRLMFLCLLSHPLYCLEFRGWFL